MQEDKKQQKPRPSNEHIESLGDLKTGKVGKEESDEAQVPGLASNILGLAIKKGATDIHLDPQEEKLVLRFRVEGVLHVEDTLPKKIQLALTTRFKTLAGLDVSERRLPQDGRISAKIDDRVVDFRIATGPANFGEKIAIRVLEKSSFIPPLDRLILNRSLLEKVREMT